ncbi:hypothetical protein PTTG_00812 [Puccinia triticina 1-1 BBBD Race 1]|uniref:Uncharacterized protein n=2 Tax=Puccinia triticina TaxID=208348 RepID=A0A0C4EJ95_PUCT1|nr:uncharacterized protein PtA15_2A343 [Puccinia triticina]OAV99571.1 hypothetical protein PTTG_00812 [Puccinia triticina 1-1 BBBD Race 1]WAQ82030.1 hypothetical protein PtA15_2A343 [Puccinia triticina]WAR52903.1 hypothetical protein PtB15_2B331 [Puccinia triticina]
MSTNLTSDPLISCYDLVAVTEEDTNVTIGLQLADKPFKFHRLAELSGHRLICDRDLWGPLRRRQTDQFTHLSVGSKTPSPVYMITICGFKWTEAPERIPACLESSWLLWTSQCWAAGLTAGKDAEGGERHPIPIGGPTVSCCSISLPAFRSVPGNEVSSDLEKFLWILANTGPKAALQPLPDWIQTDSTAKQCVDLLLDENIAVVDEKVGLHKPLSPHA